MREVAGDAVRWSESEHLLAMLVDAQMYTNYLTASAPHFKGRPKLPDPLRRPGMPDPVRRLGGKRSYSQVEFDRLRASMKPKTEGGESHRS